jgi:hypothetical protein
LSEQPSVPLNIRDVLSKAIKDLKDKFFLNTGFTFYVENHIVLQAMAGVVSSLPMAVALYAKSRAYYSHTGPDESEEQLYFRSIGHRIKNTWKKENVATLQFALMGCVHD